MPQIGQCRLLDTPILQFGRGDTLSAFDPKEGILRCHPLDYNLGHLSFSNIVVGLICFEPDAERVLNHLNRLEQKFSPPTNNKTGLNYPGFSALYTGVTLDIPSDLDDQLVSLFPAISFPSSDQAAFQEVIRLYSARMQVLLDTQLPPDVLVLYIPQVFENYFNVDGRDLRVALKAICAEKRIKTQILTEGSLSNKPGNDICEKMWQMSLAMYVKRGGIPWKIIGIDEGTCFIGIAFKIKKHTRGQEILIGLAEIFDEFGESVTIKVVEDNFISDRGYHLSTEKITNLLNSAIEGYIQEKKIAPKKVVVHKTSSFDQQEIKGASGVLTQFVEEAFDLVHIQMNTVKRLFTPHPEMYPPNRGTLWQFTENQALLYTTGFIDRYDTYPGFSIPNPIQINRDSGQTPIPHLAWQVLALTKMDWNNVNPMNRDPITIEYASKVAEILKESRSVDSFPKDFRYYI